MRPLPLARRPLSAVVEAHPVLRQSLLASFDCCPLATRFEIEGYPQTSAEAARGIVFHHFAARYIATLKAVGEGSMPTAEALEVLYEAEAQIDVADEDCVHVPAHEREVLRIAAIKFCQNVLSVEKVLAIEERLSAVVRYPGPDGEVVERVVSGKPDLVIANPAQRGVIIPDWKTTRAPPPRPAKRLEGVPKKDDPLSPEGYFQQKLYGLLAMHKWPGVETVTLREFYPLAGEAREATIERYELEHVEREVGLTVRELDRALAAGGKSPLWQPQPGRHCRYCPRPMDCPIDVEEREPPLPMTGERAVEYAGAFLVLERKRSWLREALREHVNQEGPIDVRSEKGDYQLRWRTHEASGRREFGLHPKE